ncbi:hypothetical protein [Halonotius sp. GCM10025705]
MVPVTDRDNNGGRDTDLRGKQALEGEHRWAMIMAPHSPGVADSADNWSA